MNDTVSEVNVIPVTATQAAVLYTALETALEVATKAAELKSAKAHRSALSMQQAAYRAEMARLSAAFPELK